MKSIPSNNILMRDYSFSEKDLYKIMNQCLNYYLSLEELEKFIYIHYNKLEMRLNKRYQK